MDNLELASNKSVQYSKERTGEPHLASVEDNICCFITNFGRLNIFDSSDTVQIFELDYNIVNGAIQLKYLSIWQVVFIATQSRLIVYDPNGDSLIVLYTFKTQIRGTSWNPNETFLVVVDEHNTIYGFTFQVNAGDVRYRLIDVNSTSIDVAIPASVYVGWGSHNTQFRGTARRNQENIIDILQQYTPPVISWRGSGEQFVINFWREGRRFIKVFNKYLIPEFESQPHPNLLPPVSFKGQGNFIACAALHNDANKIVIFEKNCLIKHEFWAPENEGRVISLQYHPDLNLLTAYSETLNGNGFLNIYKCYNAMWYLKQQLRYTPENKLISFHWTTIPERFVCTLHVLTHAELQKSVFRIVINRCPETSLVAVVDGTTVHFTRFSEHIIPPPMASLSLNIGNPIKKIFFDQSLNLYQFLTSNNETHHYLYENGEFKRQCGISLPDLSLNDSNDMSNLIYRIQKIVDKVSYEIMIDRQHDLLINKRVMCNNVISILVEEKYLFFTHASSKIYCVRLTLDNLLGSNWNLNKFNSREVEQGAKIVSVSKQGEVVLQAPRGNLEVVTCRMMIIDSIEQLLAQNNWGEAMDVIRLQKLSWNLLIDLNPVRFSEHIQEFIQAAEINSELQTIISEFTKEDCFDTFYAQCFEGDRTSHPEDKADVFDNILREIIRINPVLNLTTIVMFQIKHYTLKSALRSVWAMFNTGRLQLCRKAVKQILLHKHAREIIGEAFRLYHIDFMGFIFVCCSEDPSSYGPQIEHLQLLNHSERRYEMNICAKNFKGATKYLVRVPHATDQYISEFVLKHSTQKIAYENTCSNNPYFIVVSRLFSNYLAFKGRNEEAGFILSRAKLHEEALAEYRKALNWVQVLYLMRIVETAYDNKVLLNMANDLTQRNRITEAINVLETYCKEYIRAIEVLVEQKMFQRAICLAHLYDLTNMKENLIMPAIIKYKAGLKDKIEEMGNRFYEYAARLEHVRQQKSLNLKSRLVDKNQFYHNDDLYSEYGSIVSSRGSSFASGSSRSSTLSSKNRRKQEKKKTDMREGGIYEDIALIRQLYLLTVEIFECGKEVRDICLTLSDCESFHESSFIHKKLSTLQDFVLLNIPKIWTDTFLNSPDSSEPDILAVIQNRYELDPKFRLPPPPEKLTSDWKLLMFSD